MERRLIKKRPEKYVQTECSFKIHGKLCWSLEWNSIREQRKKIRAQTKRDLLILQTRIRMAHI